MKSRDFQFQVNKLICDALNDGANGGAQRGEMSPLEIVGALETQKAFAVGVYNQMVQNRREKSESGN